MTLDARHQKTLILPRSSQLQEIALNSRPLRASKPTREKKNGDNFISSAPSKGPRRSVDHDGTESIRGREVASTHTTRHDTTLTVSFLPLPSQARPMGGCRYRPWNLTARARGRGTLAGEKASPGRYKITCARARGDASAERSGLWEELLVLVNGILIWLLRKLASSQAAPDAVQHSRGGGPWMGSRS